MSSEADEEEEPSPKKPKKPMEKNQKRRNGGDLEPPREDPVSHAWLRSRSMGHQMPSQDPHQER